MNGVVARATRAPLLVVMSVALLAACAPTVNKNEGLRVVFVDNFDGTAPNPAVWATAPFGGSLPATVADGVLTITATSANDYRWGYLASTGPRVGTEPNYPFARAWQEGYFEARIRYTDDPWSWPAFWLFSMAKTEAWPGEDCTHLNSEWNIMENGVKPAGWYFTALHRNTTDHTSDGYCGQPDTQRTFSHDFAGMDLSDWHVWGGWWNADRLCTYLDGIVVQCMEPYDTTAQPMHLTFTMQYLVQCDGCRPRRKRLEMQVDWVRVWQRSSS